MAWTDPIRRAYRWAISGNGYDATKAKGKRAPATGVLSSEDAALSPTDRKKLLSATRDLHRNFTIAAWMIRKHLDYVSTFTFQARSKNEALNDSLEKLVRWWSQPVNCDASKRFSLYQIARMSEQRRLVDGDMGVMKLSAGVVQMIEGDRIRTPNGGMPAPWTAAEFTHGVKVDKAGAPLAFCICNRGETNDARGGSSDFKFERVVSASNLYHFGYFDRPDQVRGVSPLAPAVNTLRDVYEGFDYALAKMKVAQLCGLTFYREQGEPIAPTTEETDEDDTDSDTEPDGTGYKVDLGRGPLVLDLDPGDRAEFIESKTPSTEFQAFSETMVGVALKALDIPYSFYDESHTNYSGARQALLQYEQSAATKRAQVQAMLDHLLAWRIALWVQDGVLDAKLSDLQWEFIPSGLPWIDPLKEINADIAAIGAGLSSRTRILRSRGLDFREVAAELAAEQKFLTDNGLPTNLATTNAQLMGVASNE